MPDIADRDHPDRLAAREWAVNVIAEAEAEDRHLGYHNAARVILALTDPPEPTLAEEITDWAKVADNEVERTALLDTAGRAGRLETEHAERALRIDELDQECDRQSLEILDLTSERDTALGEVERLKAENKEKDRKASENVTKLLKERTALSGLVAAYREQLELAGIRLGSPRPKKSATLSTVADDGTVTHYAEGGWLDRKAHETLEDMNRLDPADVPPGEAWEVVATDPAKKIGGGITKHNAVAFRMTDRWVVSRNGYQTPLVVPDDCVHLVRRMVPSPRTIANAAALDALPVGAIIRDADGDAQKKLADDTWGYEDVATTRQLEAALLIDPITSDDLINGYTKPCEVLWLPEEKA